MGATHAAAAAEAAAAADEAVQKLKVPTPGRGSLYNKMALC